MPIPTGLTDTYNSMSAGKVTMPPKPHSLKMSINKGVSPWTVSLTAPAPKKRKVEGLLAADSSISSHDSQVSQDYICSQWGCNFSCMGYQFFEDHMLSTHERFACKFCHHTFKNRGNRTRHVRYHIVGKRHQCVDCGKFFARSDSLKEHRFIHTKSYRDSTCCNCELFFQKRTCLLAHMKKCFTDQQLETDKLPPEEIEKQMMIKKDLYKNQGQDIQHVPVKPIKDGPISSIDSDVGIMTDEHLQQEKQKLMDVQTYLDNQLASLNTSGAVPLTPRSTRNGVVNLTPRSTTSGTVTKTPRSTISGAVTLTPRSTTSGAVTETPRSTISGAVSLTPRSTICGTVTKTPRSTSGAVTLTPKSTTNGAVPFTTWNTTTILKTINVIPNKFSPGKFCKIIPHVDVNTHSENQLASITSNTISGAVSLTPQSTTSGSVTLTPRSTTTVAKTRNILPVAKTRNILPRLLPKGTIELKPQNSRFTPAEPQNSMCTPAEPQNSMCTPAEPIQIMPQLSGYPRGTIVIQPQPDYESEETTEIQPNQSA